MTYIKVYIVFFFCFFIYAYGKAVPPITIQCHEIDVGETFTVNNTIYTKVNESLLDDYVIKSNTKALETSCTSGVQNMDFLFFNSDLNPDISSWDVSNVQNMNYMFYDAVLFNADISSWDVSNVKSMYEILHNAKSFDQDISTWFIDDATKDVIYNQDHELDGYPFFYA